MRRAVAVLKLVGAHHREGITFSDLVIQSGMERSTVHRLLGALDDENLVEKDPKSKLYRLGVQAMLLGDAARERPPLVGLLRSRMEKIAQLTGDTVLLMVRHYDKALCIDRVSGNFPVKALTTDVGQQRLLGIGAGGLAIMAGISDPEIAAIHARNFAAYAEWGVPLPDLMESIRRTRERNYAEVADRVTAGATGVGVTTTLTSIMASISVAAINARLDARRRSEVAALLTAEFQPAPSLLGRDRTTPHPPRL